MPELPEVETIIRALLPCLQGRRIISYTLYTPSSLHGENNLTVLSNATINTVFRKGKLLVISLHSYEHTHYLMCFHLKMTGRLFIYPQQQSITKHTRFTFMLHDGQEVHFEDIRKFGYLRITPYEDIEAWPFWHSLGPDPLTLSSHDFVERLQKYKGRIKALLLNQQIIAGCGNIYADESLFRASLRPDRLMSTLSYNDIYTLHSALQDVLLQSIQECGSSIKDYRTAHGDVGAFQNSFYVYGRAGQACRHCTTLLQSKKIAGRTTVWCPTCQI